MVRLTNRRGMPHLDKLVVGHHEVTIFLAGIPAMLDFEAVKHEERISGERAKACGFEQFNPADDEGLPGWNIVDPTWFEARFYHRTSSPQRPDQYVEPVGAGVGRNMNLNVQPVPAEPARQVIGGILPDEVQIVVCKDMELPQSGWRSK